MLAGDGAILEVEEPGFEAVVHPAVAAADDGAPVVASLLVTRRDGWAEELAWVNRTMFQGKHADSEDEDSRQTKCSGKVTY